LAVGQRRRRIKAKREKVICDGGNFGKALLRGLSAEGTERNLRAHGGGAAWLQRFEAV